MLGGSTTGLVFSFPSIRHEQPEINKKESGNMYDREYLLQAITRMLQEATDGTLETIYYFLL